jgi:hypothetical protein
MAEVYTGVCVGGPLDRQQITVRSAAGFLAADKTTGTAWVYRRGDDGRFTVSTEPDDSLQSPPAVGLRTLQPDRAAAAAATGQLDVIAVAGS